MKKLDHTYLSFSYGSYTFAFSFTFGSLLLLWWINPFSLINYSHNKSGIPHITWHNTVEPIDISSWEVKYAEANPDVTMNPPEDTNLLSFKNQQAAEPETEKHINVNALLPKSQGESNNLKVTQGTKVDNKNNIPEPKIIEPAINSQSPLPSVITEKLPQNDLADDSDQGFSFSATQTPSKLIRLPSGNTMPSQKPNKNLKEVKGIIHRSRPKLSQQILNGPLLQNRTSAPRIGKVAIECRLHPYGIYMQEMLKSIESQWAELIKNSFRYLQLDRLPSKTTYRFTLMSSGQIKELKIRGNTDGYSLSKELCRQAIASRAPFGQWDEKMIKDLGQSDEIVITFNYK